MRRHLIGVAVLAAGLVAAIPSVASAQLSTYHACAAGGAGDPAWQEVFVYQNGNFVGPCAALYIGFYPYAGTGTGGFGLPNDSISSFKTGGGVRVRLFTDGVYAGDFLERGGNVAVVPSGWNDVTSSIRVEDNTRADDCFDVQPGEFALFRDLHGLGDCVVLRHGPTYPTPESMGIANDSVSTVYAGPVATGHVSCSEKGTTWVQALYLYSGAWLTGYSLSIPPNWFVEMDSALSGTGVPSNALDNALSSIQSSIRCH